jgi:hypothetical protein
VKTLDCPDLDEGGALRRYRLEGVAVELRVRETSSSAAN